MGANWAAGLSTTGTVTLFGPAPRPALSVANAEADEGDPVTFTVTLSAADTEEVTATWAASVQTDDTAVAADFTDLSAATGTLTVDAGKTTGTFTVATREDTADEENETFTVTLSSASSNAQLAADATTAKGTIVNDDDPARDRRRECRGDRRR